MLLEERPDVVLAEGDTNSVLATALAASKLYIKFGHVEAGLRSYDRNMPEEINRTLTDHCSDYLFAPTEKAKKILLGEGIPEEKIFVTGNTIVDAIYQNLEIAKKSSSNSKIKPIDSGLKTLNSELSTHDSRLATQNYILVTLHRQENVDNPQRFASILQGLKRIANDFNMPVVFPVHPRSQKMMKHFNLEHRTLNIELIEPLDLLSFLQLEANARLILTDSGGVQEEACILGVPCITLRDNTERSETLEVGSNILAGAASDKIVECCGQMLGSKNSWNNPFGDGKAGQRIVKILQAEVGHGICEKGNG